jgi:hypothetical protein
VGGYPSILGTGWCALGTGQYQRESMSVLVSCGVPSNGGWICKHSSRSSSLGEHGLLMCGSKYEGSVVEGQVRKGGLYRVVVSRNSEVEC